MSVQEMSGFRSRKASRFLVFGRARPPVPEMASPEEAASGAEPFDVRELQGRIDAVLEREHASWGVLVYSTGLGRDIAAHRPDTALVPASNVKLFTALASRSADEYAQNVVKYAHMHSDIVQRFGRFPHRNEILGRESTAEELEFLQGPNSSF